MSRVDERLEAEVNSTPATPREGLGKKRARPAKGYFEVAFNGRRACDKTRFKVTFLSGIVQNPAGAAVPEVVGSGTIGFVQRNSRHKAV